MKKQFYIDIYGESFEPTSQLCCPDEYLESFIPHNFVGKTLVSIGLDDSYTSWVLTFDDGTAMAFIPGKSEPHQESSRYSDGMEVRVGQVPNNIVRIFK